MTNRSPNRLPGIYAITSQVNETTYIGQANNIAQRWAMHRLSLRKGTHNSRHLQNAWAKYGEEAFVFSIVRDLSGVPRELLPEALNKAEIEELSALHRSYNLMEAGKSGMLASAETKAILSERQLSIWSDPDTREKRLATLREIHSNPEYTKRRMAALIEAKRTPKSRAKVAVEATERWANPDFRAAMGEKKRLSWQDPAYREKQSKSRAETWNNPEVRARRMAGLIKSANDPGVKAARTAGIQKARHQMAESKRENWKDPAYRANQSISRSAGQKARYSDPEERKRQSEMAKASWAKRKSVPNQLIPVDNPMLPTPRSGVVKQQSLVDLLLVMFRHVRPAE